MSDMTLDLADNGMVAVTKDALAALRNALMRDTGPAAAGYFQEAGYAGGAALFEAFRGWLIKRGASSPETLSLGDFQRLAAEFFEEAGWGSLTVGSLHDTVATLDSPNWGEASADGGMEHPCCHLSAGMFADFFGRVADAPLAVMEVECRSTGAERCRFLLGSTEVMQAVYDAMSAGHEYDAAVESAA
ncbi:MAG: V4R domain-containing protein [Gemmatimonadaceae bacterium]